MRTPLAPALLLLWVAAALTGCGGYADTSQAFRASLTHGAPEEALLAVNEALGVPSAEMLPAEKQTETPLLLLERATILQALQQYKLSARDFQLADKDLIVLDLTSDTAGEIAKYMFSDDATVYKAPPHEKLLINTLNLLNYLAMGDAQGAKVEARRIVISQKYLEGVTDEKRLSTMALASYLAGFAFEVAGEPEAAMRHYGDAKDAGGVATLERAVKTLAARSGASDPRLKVWTEGVSADSVDRDAADVLVVVQTGMAPFKQSKRLPIGAALVAASDPGPGARLSRQEQRRAQAFAAKGVLKWINYPALRRARLPEGPISVAVDGQAVESGNGLFVSQAVLAEFQRHEGSLIAGAITRMITRAVAGELSGAAANKGSNNGLAGLLVGLAVEGAMAAADTPDTRSWVTLPERIQVARARVAPGQRTITVRHLGRDHTATLDLQPGGWAVVNFSGWR
ncbi:MAG: hypothetical protein KC613_01820 [Myxococcales bacterium]|nr:hypothetical protein [Myxococcales bacterium]MCB9521870.1 hypothetical protein [Myxococcales bacterium]